MSSTLYSDRSQSTWYLLVFACLFYRSVFSLKRLDISITKFPTQPHAVMGLDKGCHVGICRLGKGWSKERTEEKMRKGELHRARRRMEKTKVVAKLLGEAGSSSEIAAGCKLQN